MTYKENPHFRKRDPLAAICAAIIFGSILSPFWQIAFGVLNRFAPAFAAISLPGLTASTGILFAVLLRETRLERVLRRRLGSTFSLSLGLILALALVVNYALLGIMAKFTLLSSIEYWFVLVATLYISFGLCLIVVSLSPASRIEVIIGRKLREESGPSCWYRACTYVLLILTIALSCWIGYRFYTAGPAFPG
jgi:hypothetical protein